MMAIERPFRGARQRLRLKLGGLDRSTWLSVDGLLGVLASSNEQAANLKLADRIANVEAACTEGLFGLIEMYRQELPLYDAVFRLGKPEMYARLKAALKS